MWSRLTQEAVASAEVRTGPRIFPETGSSPSFPATIEVRVRYAGRLVLDIFGERVVVIVHSGGAAYGLDVSVAGGKFSGEYVASEGMLDVDGFIGLDGAFPVLKFVPESRFQQAGEAEWACIDPYHYQDAPPPRPAAPLQAKIGVPMIMPRLPRPLLHSEVANSR